jgi:hypothetical protein
LSVGGIRHHQELHLAETHLLRPFASPVDHGSVAALWRP